VVVTSSHTFYLHHKLLKGNEKPTADEKAELENSFESETPASGCPSTGKTFGGLYNLHSQEVAERQPKACYNRALDNKLARDDSSGENTLLYKLSFSPTFLTDQYIPRESLNASVDQRGG